MKCCSPAESAPELKLSVFCTFSKRSTADMEELKNTRMDEPCDICGDNGGKELIVTCTKCKISSEHVYCMRILPSRIPDDWVCESCFEGEKVAGKTVVASIYQGMQSKARWRRPVQTGKVKFLPCAEVIKLTTGAAMYGAPVKSKITVARRTPVGTKTLTSLYQSSMKVNPTLDQVKASKDTSARIKTTCQQPSRASMPCEGRANVKHKYSDYEDRDLLDVLPKIHQYQPFFPASQVVWKGRFVLRDIVASGEFYGEFQAQPPCRVHRKAYEASKKLPPVLQVELLPESLFKADLFLDDSLHLHDIALYFFRSDHIERLKQKNSPVVDQLEIHSSIMRSYFDGVELLIFASKHLHHDSQKIIAKLIEDSLLLGVFRPTKNDKVESRECMAIASPAGHSHMCDTKAKIKDEVESWKCKAVVSPAGCDMKSKFEADETKADKKQTGKNSLISRLDAAIKEQKLKSNLQKLKERDESPLAAKKIKEEIENELPLKSSSIAGNKLDHPPGFEKRQR